MQDRIIAVIKSIRPDLSLDENAGLIDEGLLDSFDIISIVAGLEKEFDMHIHREKIIAKNFNSLRDIERLIEECRG